MSERSYFLTLKAVAIVFQIIGALFVCSAVYAVLDEPVRVISALMSLSGSIFFIANARLMLIIYNCWKKEQR